MSEFSKTSEEEYLKESLDDTELNEPIVESKPDVDVELEPRAIWGEATLFLLYVVLPIALTGLLLGRRFVIPKLLMYLDKTYLSVFCPAFSKREKLLKWVSDRLPHTGSPRVSLQSMWQDGSLLCTLINSLVPGACPNPHRHWRKPPSHGQALAYKYLKVIPMFSEDDFKDFNPGKEIQLIDYLSLVQQSIDKLSKPEIMSYSNSYVARGMGLVTGEQYRTAVIYIYPNTASVCSLDDLIMNIRGPYDTYGCASLTATTFNYFVCNPKEKQVSKSFFKTLSKDFSKLLNKGKGAPSCDIEVKVESEKDRVKIAFIPNHSGIYEICFTTGGQHISGSPFNVNVEKNRSGITDDLKDDKSVRSEYKYRGSQNKMVYDTVVRYEKINQQNMEGTETSLNQLDPEKCEIISKSNFEKSQGIDINKSDKLETRENFGLKIIDTIRDIPAFKIKEATNPEKITFKTYSINNEEPVIATASENQKEHDFDLTPKELLKSLVNFENLSRNLSVDENMNISNTKKELETFNFEKGDTSQVATTLTNESLPHNMLEHVDNSQNLEPDSLTSSIVESNSDNNSTSLDELSSGVFTSSNVSSNGAINTITDIAHQTNNDMMIKSNEDICYLVLNKGTKERVYSKDFIRCTETSSAPDIPSHLERQDASRILKNIVQEVSTSRPLSLPIPCEASRLSLQGNSREAEMGERRYKEFQDTFRRRKAYWTDKTSNQPRDDGWVCKRERREKAPLKRGTSLDNHVTRESTVRDRVDGYYESIGTTGFTRYGSVDQLDLHGDLGANDECEKDVPLSKGVKLDYTLEEKVKQYEISVASTTSKDLLKVLESSTVKTKIKETFHKAQFYFKEKERGCHFHEDGI